VPDGEGGGAAVSSRRGVAVDGFLLTYDGSLGLAFWALGERKRRAGLLG
jgi:hypothetical protein